VGGVGGGGGFGIRQKSAEKLIELCLPYLIEKGLIEPQFKSTQYPPAYGAMEITQTYKIKETGEEITLDYLKKIVSIYQERMKKISEITELTDFFFKGSLGYDKNLLKWKEMSNDELTDSLDRLEKILSEIEIRNWVKENLEKIIMSEAEAGDRGKLLWPLRAALTGKESSAGPFEIAELLGKEKTLKRIKEAYDLSNTRA